MLFQKNQDIEISFEPSNEERILQMRFPLIMGKVKVKEKETFVFPKQHGLKLSEQYFPIKIPSNVTKLTIRDIVNTKPRAFFISIYLKNTEIFKFKETENSAFLDGSNILYSLTGEAFIL